jgi:hypothetical protein
LGWIVREVDWIVTELVGRLVIWKCLGISECVGGGNEKVIDV